MVISVSPIGVGGTKRGPGRCRKSFLQDYTRTTAFLLRGISFFHRIGPKRPGVRAGVLGLGVGAGVLAWQVGALGVRAPDQHFGLRFVPGPVRTGFQGAGPVIDLYLFWGSVGDVLRFMHMLFGQNVVFLYHLRDVACSGPPDGHGVDSPALEPLPITLQPTNFFLWFSVTPIGFSSNSRSF